MKIKLHESTLGPEEIAAATEVLQSGQVTSGELVHEFESKFGPNAVFVNSGSSANLLAIAALCSPLNPNRLEPGDEVIVPALCWSTTIFPLVQYGLIPKIVDIDPHTLNMDPVEVEKAITPRTRAVMPVHVYGNPCDMSPIRHLCIDNDLVLIADSCEALGARLYGFPIKQMGDFSTFSFYFSHHITTLEGGMAVAADAEHAEIMRVIRAHGWTRDTQASTLTKWTDNGWADEGWGIDPRFLFVDAGYNLRSTELNAAIGLEQLKKLDGFVAARRKARGLLYDAIIQYEPWLSTQETTSGSNPSWFSFAIIVNEDAPFTAAELRAHLEENGIETRSIIAGNIARQPAMALYPHVIQGRLEYADHVMRAGFSIGCHQAMTEEDCAYVSEVLDDFFGLRGLD